MLTALRRKWRSGPPRSWVGSGIVPVALLTSLGVGASSLLMRPGYDEYYWYLTESENRAQELPHFVAAVSTNETYFFREDNHFTALSTIVLPELLRTHATVCCNHRAGRGDEDIYAA